MSLRSNRKPALGQRSTSQNTQPWWALNLSPQYDQVILVSGSLNMTAVSKTSYVCLISNAVIQDCKTRCRRPWAHVSVIHAASHFYNEKRVAWVSISMHAFDPVPIVMGLRLAALRVPGASLLGMHTMFSWQLSYQETRWPVSRDLIAGSGVELIKIACFF